MLLVDVRGHHFCGGLLSGQSVVIDLGANNGDFSKEIVAQYACRCIAVEAQPELAKKLKSVPGFTTYHAAIGACDGEVLLDLDDNPEFNRVVEEASSRSVRVPGIRLATLCEREGIQRIDLMKVDIEGAEIALFNSMSDAQLLSVDQVAIEFHDFIQALGLEAQVDQVLSRMKSLGFRILVFSRRSRSDVLLINPQAWKRLSAAARAYLRWPAHYVEGGKRLSARWWSAATSVRATGDLSAQREMRAWLSARVGVLSKVAMIGVRLLSVPLALHVLGTERYGLWLAVWSLLTWLGISDLGMGAALINAVGGALGRGETARARSYVATLIVSNAVASGLMVLAVAAFSRWGGLPAFVGVRANPDLATDARHLVLAGGVVFALTFLLNPTTQLCNALQKSYLASAASTVGSALGVVALAAVAWAHGGTVAFVLAIGVPPVVALAALAIYLLWFAHPELRPRTQDAAMEQFRDLLAKGGLVMMVQGAGVVVAQVPRWMIANRLGPAAVVPFGVTYSLLYFGYALAATYTGPLWPAYADASARQEWTWIRKTVRGSITTVGLCVGAFAVGALVLGRVTIKLWAGADAVPTWPLLAALCIYFWLYALDGCLGMVTSGLGLFRVQAVSAVLSGSVLVLGSWMLLGPLGPAGVGVAGTLAVALEMGILALAYAGASRSGQLRTEHER